MTPWPKVTKTATYRFRAWHDLAGKTIHPDATEPHEHDWVVTLTFEDWEVRLDKGFTRDEPEIGASWGRRIAELEGVNLNSLMPVPPTAENMAMWLLFDWLTHLSPIELNFEVTRCRVAKCDTYTAEVHRTQRKRWDAFLEDMKQREEP
jgi:hypothetical protein